MKESEKPIYPIVESQNMGFGERAMLCSEIGLTKREYFAAMAMQAIISKYDPKPNLILSDSAMDYIAQKSISMADAMFKSLENQSK